MAAVDCLRSGSIGEGVDDLPRALGLSVAVVDWDDRLQHRCVHEGEVERVGGDHANGSARVGKRQDLVGRGQCVEEGLNLRL
mgnify:CR=1 FL=1